MKRVLAFLIFVSGADADVYSFKTGYLLPWHISMGSFQPNIHFECIDPDTHGATYIFGGGLNWFLKGHANKVSIDITSVEQQEEISGQRPVQEHLIATFQLALGF